jgi:formylmethanofuran dehydrogenase subunit B
MAPRRLAQAATGPDSASLDDAVARAAAILNESRCAVIAGLGTDYAGAEAAIALARQIGGVFDHLHSAAALRDLDAMRTAGWIVTTPLQARARADLLLLVGSGLSEAWPEIWRHLRPDLPPKLGTDTPRRVIRLCPGRDAAPPDVDAEDIGARTAELPALLGALRAIVAGRRIALPAARAKALAQCAEALRAARYGVVIWSAAALDALSVEMLCGLIDELNTKTRFAGLPLGPGDNAQAVIQAGAAQCGFPFRVGFGSGTAEHDPWRFDAHRLVESGEADAAVWISALSPLPPPWSANLPTIALVAPDTRFVTSPAVAITVGRPGVDHDGVLYAPELGALAHRPASAPSALPNVAETIGRIALALKETAAC